MLTLDLDNFLRLGLGSRRGDFEGVRNVEDSKASGCVSNESRRSSDWTDSISVENRITNETGK